MTAQSYALAAQGVLVLHLCVVLFNLFGLIAVPLGAWRGWGFVRVFWWRAAHLAAMGVVVLQALFGRPCFLTLWQAALEEHAGLPGARTPLIARIVADVLYWPLPLWVFCVLYSLALMVSLLLWRLVPPMKNMRAPARG